MFSYTILEEDATKFLFWTSLLHPNIRPWAEQSTKAFLQALVGCHGRSCVSWFLIAATNDVEVKSCGAVVASSDCGAVVASSDSTCGIPACSPCLFLSRERPLERESAFSNSAVSANGTVLAPPTLYLYYELRGTLEFLCCCLVYIQYTRRINITGRQVRVQ